jgi:zinc transporter 7
MGWFKFSSLGIFVGFAAFFFMEKTLRVLGSDEDAHGHSHSHSQPYVSPEVIKNSSIKESATEDGPRSRNKTVTNGSSSSPEPEIPGTVNGPSKLSAYLNLFGDFVHNMSVLKLFCYLQMTLFLPNSTDGLA